MTTLRWLHLSDFHTGKDGYGQSRLFQYILDHVKSRGQSNKAPAFVFITGDIANKGQSAQYEEFNKGFLFPLIDLLPHDTQDRIYLIPGNHDVDRNQTRAAQIYDIQVKIPEFFDPDEKGRFERQQTVFPRFQAFVDNDLTNIENHWLFSPDGTFSKIVSFGNAKIGVLGINTAWLSFSDYDRNKLSAGKGLLETGLERIKDCDLKFVLGHHPLDWLLDTEMEPVRALFGRYNTIYLHGHMHKGRAKYEEGAGYPFLALQSGACFQAREDDLWVNRFLSCEMDLETREISVEPLQWSRDNQEWALDSLAFPEKYRQGDRWIVSLPSPAPVEGKPVSGKGISQKLRDLPKGWVIVDAKYLKSLSNEMTAEQALSFFDGRAPIWRDALATQIPKREIVNKLVESLNGARQVGGLQVTLLIGAAGEGKTTAFMQAICDLVNKSNEWHILWHDDTSSPFPAEFIARLPKGGTWLIASDDAELIARRVYETAQLLTDRYDIQFLLCSRDTDWKALGVDSHNWKQHNVKFTQLSLRGLSSVDAEQVVLAWSKYGKEGLKHLSDLTAKDATLQLIQAAKSEETNQIEGTFFGAVLQVRLGEELKDHIRSLLEKLNAHKISNNRTLKDAFSYIAAMHSENLQFLSKEVLAHSLGVNLGELKRKVLFPLGEEAAIATTGRYVFTRHRSIANVTLNILSEETDVDSDNLYVDLSQSAIRAFIAREYIPNIGDWNYLSTYFFNRGNIALGIKLAEAAIEIDPDDPYFIVKLAQLYREAGQPEQSVKLFRSYKFKVERNQRPFYYEWGTAEGNTGKHALGIYLSAFALSDEAVRRPPNNDEAKIILSGMSLAFAELHENFNLQSYVEACGAAAQLGLSLILDIKGRNWLTRSLNKAKENGVKEVSLPVAFDRLRAGVVSAWEQREDNLPKWITPVTELNFNGLARLLRI